MTRWKFILIPLVLIQFAHISASEAREQPFSIQIKATQSVIRPRQELDLTIILTNISAKEEELEQEHTGRRAEVYYQFSVVRDADGKPVVDTPYGLRTKGKSLAPMQWNRTTTKLQPGEATQDTVVVNKLYDLSQPGTYMIHVTREVPTALGGGIVKSNQITVTVSP